MYRQIRFIFLVILCFNLLIKPSLSDEMPYHLVIHENHGFHSLILNLGQKINLYSVNKALASNNRVFWGALYGDIDEHGTTYVAPKIMPYGGVDYIICVNPGEEDATIQIPISLKDTKNEISQPSYADIKVSVKEKININFDGRNKSVTGFAIPIWSENNKIRIMAQPDNPKKLDLSICYRNGPFNIVTKHYTKSNDEITMSSNWIKYINASEWEKRGTVYGKFSKKIRDKIIKKYKNVPVGYFKTEVFWKPYKLIMLRYNDYYKISLDLKSLIYSHSTIEWKFGSAMDYKPDWIRSQWGGASLDAPNWAELGEPMMIQQDPMDPNNIERLDK